TNATIEGPPNGNSINYRATGGGDVSLTVYALSNYGCFATSTIQIPFGSLTPPVITAPSGACAGQTGTATVTNSALYTSYAWTIANGSITGPSTGASVQYTPDGTGDVVLTVTASDDSGCSVTGGTTVPRLTPADATITSGTVCYGQVASASVPDAGPDATYNWAITGGSFSGGTSGRIVYFSASSPLSSLTLMATVSSPNACASSASKTVTVSSLPNTAFTAPTNVCRNASYTATASDTTPGTTYLWSAIQNVNITSSPTAPTVTFSIPSSGTNQAVLRLQVSRNGCVTNGSKTMSIGPPLPPTPTISANGPTTFCAPGSVTLTSSPGPNYLWSNGATTPSISVTTSGNYTVTFTNGSGCSSTSAPRSVTVNPKPVPVITPSGPTTFCAGGSVTLTASGAATYLWSNGATTPSITVTSSGVYWVTGTSNGCSATSSNAFVTVNSPQVTAPSIVGPNALCPGVSTTLTANPAGAASYLWSNGATTRSITVTTPGTYTVSVAGSNGCPLVSPPWTVAPATLASITAAGPTTFCPGGSVKLSSTNTAYAYRWSNGATTPSITVSTAGSYTLTTTSTTGCVTTSAPTVVSVIPTAFPMITASGGPLCPNGSVTLTATPATDVTYYWSTGATTQSIVVTAPGTYYVTTTNASGCSRTAGTSVVSAPQASITANGPTIFCEGGSVTLSSTNTGSSYLWSNGATTPSITVSSAGLYTLTTTSSGCTTTSAPSTVFVNPLPEVTITADGPTTFDEGGSVLLTANGGPYANYRWSTGETGPSIYVTAAGDYTVTATNPTGCSSTSAPMSVTVNPLP
ncbi:MAG: hypothetical protein ACXV7D_01020, partial [Thermoanaerobaculia bacterium]